MANCEFFDLSEEDCKESHARSQRGHGEKDYIDHLRAQRLSVAERIVVFLVLALVGAFSFGVRAPGNVAIDPRPVASVVQSADPLDGMRCGEYSPYRDDRC